MTNPVPVPDMHDTRTRNRHRTNRVEAPVSGKCVMGITQLKAHISMTSCTRDVSTYSEVSHLSGSLFLGIFPVVFSCSGDAEVA